MTTKANSPTVLSGLFDLAACLTNAFGNADHPGYAVLSDAVNAAKSREERASYTATTVDLIRKDQAHAATRKWVACIAFIVLSSAAIAIQSRTP